MRSFPCVLSETQQTKQADLVHPDIHHAASIAFGRQHHLDLSPKFTQETTMWIIMTPAGVKHAGGRGIADHTEEVVETLSHQDT